MNVSPQFSQENEAKGHVTTTTPHEEEEKDEKLSPEEKKKKRDKERVKEAEKQARQELRDEPEIEASPAEKYLDLMGVSTKYLKTITGHKLTWTEFEYEITKHVKPTEFYRKEIVEAMGERELIALRNRLIVVDNSTNSMINLIDKRIP